jgi:DNA polymerase-1
VSLDIETDGDEIVCLALSNGRKVVVGWELPSFPGLQELLDRAIIVGHYLTFDFRDYLTPRGYYPSKVWDTFLVEKVLTAGLRLGLALEDLAFRYLGLRLDKSYQTSFKVGQEPTPGQLQYVADDVLVPLALVREQFRRLRASTSLQRVVGLETQVFRALLYLTPVHVDQQRLQEYRRATEQQVQTIEQELGALLEVGHTLSHNRKYEQSVQTYEAWDRERKQYLTTLADQGANLKELREAERAWKKLHPKPKVLPAIAAPINLRSTVQVLEALNTLGIAVPNLRKETLEHYVPGNPDHMVLLGKLLEYKEHHKLLSSFLEPLSALGVTFRPRFNQLVDSGRFSCEEPNMQQVPPRIRGIFVPPKGMRIVKADYSQIEMRIAAQISGDPVLIDAFRNDKDTHIITACEAWQVDYDTFKARVDEKDPEYVERRKQAKHANFARLYGGGVGAVRTKLKCDEETARRVVEAVDRAYRQYAEWAATQEDMALRFGVVFTMMGRPRFFDPPQDEKEAWAVRREARNHPIQGTAADMFKLAFVTIMNDLYPQVQVWNLVHDEIDAYVPEDQAERLGQEIERRMRLAGQQFLPDVPVLVEWEVVERWK